MKVNNIKEILNKEKLVYCSKCILPNTRPNIRFDINGENCNCATAERKAAINWTFREEQWRKVVSTAKSRESVYDCVIPVSGGKDSTWQVLKALECSLKPLCVTWRTPVRTELGEANLRNLISLGVNHFDITIDPKVERRFTLKAFERQGSPVIPMHMALHAIPLQLAVQFKIPLILWGENSAYEYGGDDEELKGVHLTQSWLKKYGVTNGTTAEDWIAEDLTAQDLAPYFWPSDKAQASAGVTAVFLGHYFCWDPNETFKFSAAHGFKAASKPKTGYYNFADIDDGFLITIHHWMKWYKFGFTRLWDNLSLEIRAGRITRKEAIELVRKVGEELPREEIEEFCNYVGISESRFFEIAETFRNKDVWIDSGRGRWSIPGFLIDNWDW
jgi:N-acetyl sugar amidotransferase